MTTMTSRQYENFIQDGTRTAKIATVRADGSPHVTPVWFVLDGDDLVFVTSAASAKGHDLLRTSQVALCIEDDDPPFSFVVVEGTTTTEDDPEDVLYWSTRNAARYMGEDQAEQYGRLNAGEGMMTVRVTPTKIIAEKDLTEV
ncbi:PPOX class F420-dependent oxidoreductase [Actinoalloteichus hymeniacidonis]|uniref:PPOX class putative F420-dependent enzyme n=1 Tax=Actinoalloteichus hymeniacidonis TaxID=340345 RepID=A0AAC9MZY5_9PSEU|nr:PPOX class F420-dependent oxidoreductase [Actinoalloteichus hymeniacidonis]AOS64994.1 PPOX class putative F420-dependent enzyme [Actinoalloteichus hymeniacidonis]MBB5906930.1 PPOX class probable F420-dependent enzyme [Actinoalloteichus hymeniacidonis]